mmetsp:Transcript_26904/g.62501  ORF Transcript_26904/g.62501 Transcript_26904/m.62501 type:complete len:98 (+) Transcript_26904:1533-1826(+)
METMTFLMFASAPLAERQEMVPVEMNYIYRAKYQAHKEYNPPLDHTPQTGRGPKCHTINSPHRRANVIRIVVTNKHLFPHHHLMYHIARETLSYKKK